MKKIILIFTLIFVFFYGFSQGDTIKIAEELIYNENFERAIRFYKKLISMDENNPDYHYNLGFCYLNTVSKRDSAINPLKKSIEVFDNLSKRKKRKVNTDPLEMKFYLARAYRVNYKFGSAIEILDEILKNTKNKKIIELVENEKKLCIDGKKLLKEPKKIEIKNLGPIINTEYTEHTPVFSPDESELIFTSRKKLFDHSKSSFDNEYDENIYISKKDTNGNWVKPVPIQNINTEDHEATISLSYDESKLFIYKDEDEGSIYYSNYQNDKWQKPIKLGSYINTKHRETHASLSYDGTTLFFTSDRPGGYGGLDIYYSKKLPNGEWGPAKNVGKAINSPKDEEAPYILPDGKTLYFSSKGKGGLGGFDIFKSTLNEFGTWTLPQNLGYPVNSIDDDVFFFPTPNQKRAYFASKKDFQNFGSSDIYLMKLPEEKKSPLVVMTAKLTVCEGELPYADVLITDNTTDEYYIATPKDGKFVFVTKKGHNYSVQVDVEGEQVFSDTFDVSLDAPDVMMYKAIRLDPGVPCDNVVSLTKDDLIDPKRIGPDGTIYDAYVEIDNILFPLNRVGKISPNETLDTLVSFLNRNPEAVIEVGGYCDASGRASYNYILGQRRADAVKEYLVEKGVNPQQVEAVSYGEENPIAVNRNDDGTWNREGLKYNRRVEFRLLKQGQETLLIWGMKIPKKLKNPDYKFNYKKAEKNNIETLN